MFKVSYSLLAKSKALHESNNKAKRELMENSRSPRSSPFFHPSQHASLFCRDYSLQACDWNRPWEANLANLANETPWEARGLRSNLASERRFTNMLGFENTTEAHYTRLLKTCHFAPSQIKAKSREQCRIAGKNHFWFTQTWREMTWNLTSSFSWFVYCKLLAYIHAFLEANTSPQLSNSSCSPWTSKMPKRTC